MTLRNEIRLALRRVVRAPLWFGTVVLLLALSLSGNVAIFSVLRTVLLQPLPVEEPAALFSIWNRYPSSEGERTPLSPPQLADFAGIDSLQRIGAYSTRRMALAADQPRTVTVASVSEGFHDALRPPLRVGRLFLGSDFSGDEKVAVLGQHLWQERFAGSPSAVGATLLLDDQPHQVVGVVAEGSELPLHAEVWVPLLLRPEARTYNRSNQFLHVIGRLADDAGAERLNAELAALSQALRREHPDAYPAESGFELAAKPLSEVLVEDAEPLLQALSGTFLLLLLIAASNVASLFVARDAGRHQEDATRLALGAGRGHLIFQRVVEALLIGAVSALAALVLGRLLLKALASRIPAQILEGRELEIDGGTALLAVALTAATVAVAIALPGVWLLRRHASLPAGHRGLSWNRRIARLFGGIVIVQVALALTLLVGASLLVQSLRDLSKVELGFERGAVLTMKITPAASRFPEDHQLVAFHRRLLPSIQALPGVRAAATSSGVPLMPGTWTLPFVAQGASPRTRGLMPEAHVRVVSTDYFRALGVDVVEGRPFDASDTEESAPSVILDRRLASRTWGSADAIGRRIKLGEPDEDLPWMTVVGVVADVRHTGPREPAPPHLYLPFPQFPLRNMNLVVRTDSAGPSLIAPIRQVVAEVAPGLPVDDVATMQERVDEVMEKERSAAALVGGCALLAWLLVAGGFYGFTANAVAGRRFELALRSALGADRSNLLRLVTRNVLAFAFAGLLLGLFGAAALGRLLAELLYDVDPLDPLTVLGSLLSLSATYLALTLLAAHRGIDDDPARLLNPDRADRPQ